MSDLCERMRADLPTIDGYNGPYVDEDFVYDLMGEAIDRIEELEAENERLRAVFAAAKEFDDALDVPGANVGSPRLAMHKAILAALQETEK